MKIAWRCLALLGLAFAAHAVELTDTLRMDHPVFNAQRSFVAVGRDGRVYLTTWGEHRPSYCMRIDADGGNPGGSLVGESTVCVNANSSGVMLAQRVAWNGQSIAIFDKDFNQIFSKKYGMGPDGVAVGESGDFYIRANGFTRIAPDGHEVQRIKNPVKGMPDRTAEFRVCEKLEIIYVLGGDNQINYVGFDGKLLGKTPHQMRGFHTGFGGSVGGFDVDEEGRVYALESGKNKVAVYEIKKGLEDEVITQRSEVVLDKKLGWVMGFRVAGKDLVIREKDSPFLFRRFDRKTGALTGEIRPRGARLKVSYPGETWEAGQAIPFTIDFSTHGAPMAPLWRAWARPLGSLSFRELAMADGKLQVPADFGGIYDIKVSAEPSPLGRLSGSDLAARGIVEVRRPGAKGTACVYTPQSRLWYGQGEAIPFFVALSPGIKAVTPLKVQLLRGETSIMEWQASVEPGKPAQLEVPATLTRRLAPGEYMLTPDAAGMTPAAQCLIIGEGIRPVAVRGVLFADFGSSYARLPESLHSLPDSVAVQMRYLKNAGWNWVYDRWGDIGYPANVATPEWLTTANADLVKRFATEQGVVADKLQLAPFVDQLVAAEGANGVSRMIGLLNMDAGLPLGSGYDKRKPEAMDQTLRELAARFKNYPAFSGFSWASLWWMYGGGYKDKQEGDAFKAAIDAAKNTGKWDPLIETVAARRIEIQRSSWERFNTILKEVAPDAVTCTAPAFKNHTCYPPLTFDNVGQIDLQQQFEQMSVPYHGPLMVDYYSRPGKPAWSHPELGNGMGTGDHSLPWLFMCFARGAAGVGSQSRVPGWGYFQTDPRESRAGYMTGYMRFGEVLRAFGPWMKTLQRADRVAIVVCKRMSSATMGNNAVGSGYFNRLTEAYIACLHAHHWPGFVFEEDLGPQGLAAYKAVLVVSQWIEPDSVLAAALRNAKSAGVRIFSDATCRGEFVEGCEPLGFGFDNLEKDVSHAGDDAAFHRFPRYARKNLAALKKALDSAVQPAADTGNDEVFFSESRSEKGRYVFAFNNSMLHMDPALMYRVSLFTAHRVPVKADVTLSGAAGHVYELLGRRRVEPENGKYAADLRSMPARIFAVLPAAIEQLELKAPASVSAGQTVAWSVSVRDGGGKVIEAGIPVAVRISLANGTVIEEQFAAAGSQGAAGAFRLPFDAAAGELRIQAMELAAGKSAELKLQVKAAELPLKKIPDESNAPAADAGRPAMPFIPPPEDHFSAHAKDVIIADGGKLAVINTFNWDHNLYGLDLETGKIRFRQRLGNYFAFSPREIPGGFVAQGYDLNEAEGYHLYICGLDGKPERRFATYGLPRRLPSRFLPTSWEWDRNNSHSVAPDGSWIATAGNLGVAVWSRDGTLLWKQDAANRREVALAAWDANTLMVMDRTVARLVDAKSGQDRSTLLTTASGEFIDVQFDRARETCLLLGTADGGQLYVLRQGKLAATHPICLAGRFSCQVHLSADGRHAVAASNTDLRFYSLEKGLLWTFAGDDQLRDPQIADDGRVAVSSALGTLYVFSADGKLLLDRALGSLCRPAWLPDGDLLAASWMGPVHRLDKNFNERWRAWLRPEETDMRERILASDGTPTARVPSFGNADPKAAPLAPNLLAETPFKFVFLRADNGGVMKPLHDTALLFDGKPDAPPSAWLDWSPLNYASTNFEPTYLECDAQGKAFELRGVTLAEDPAAPQSWLRDLPLDYWDRSKSIWVRAKDLVSNAPQHTHWFEPVKTNKVRLVLKSGQNPRLGELVLHGAVASEPAAEKTPAKAPAKK